MLLKSIKNVKTYCGYIMKLKKRSLEGKMKWKVLRKEVWKVYGKVQLSFYEF